MKSDKGIRGQGAEQGSALGAKEALKNNAFLIRVVPLRKAQLTCELYGNLEN
jgi:hypothetical protein